PRDQHFVAADSACTCLLPNLQRTSWKESGYFFNFLKSCFAHFGNLPCPDPTLGLLMLRLFSFSSRLSLLFSSNFISCKDFIILSQYLVMNSLMNTQLWHFLFGS
ncbi:hypothetical protein PFISCL1PPCAC_17190, partial [Pristionchus fissidentatus]